MSNDEFQQQQFWDKKAIIINLIKTKLGDMNVTIVHFPLWHGPIENYKNNPDYTIEQIIQYK